MRCCCCCCCANAPPTTVPEEITGSITPEYSDATTGDNFTTSSSLTAPAFVRKSSSVISGSSPAVKFSGTGGEPS
ncbi:hypothetical protein HanIR_Chr11g0523501 [Helianthus annuus]|nr:hypothetical protein HanIR_Chr11g0523501 [Helianthus annuus]